MDRVLYYLLFFFSGLAGLIFEHIWTHYIKLFLGHAAYAQALVIVIFMGGMGLGAAVAGKFSRRIKNPFMAYALVELIIGLWALLFHPLYQLVTGFAYNELIPGLDSPFSIQLLKWVLGAALILPQSILLGATFPLMSGGLVRCSAGGEGRSLGLLYFVNSLGGATGLLIAGYLLIDELGLPGTIITGGSISLLVALIVALRSYRLTGLTPLSEEETNNKIEILPSADRRGKVILLFLCAGLTGAASFFYEIGWIRMLSIVLGNSTHSFELILSSFILGLALGGLLIQFKIDSLKNSIRTLAIIQLVMAACALLTIPLYNQSFDVMAKVMAALPRSDTGYLLFNISSFGIAVATVLPATICAGMTLPLLTKILITAGFGERSIGGIYAANTIGSILGTLGAILIMPYVGLKNVITTGAAIDIFAGLTLLWFARPKITLRRIVAVASGAAVLLFVAVTLFRFDPLRMASGSNIFRNSKIYPEHGSKIDFHKDGRSATIDVLTVNNNARFIVSNGKVEAGVALGSSGSVDEYTMIFLAALPLLANPAAKQAAIIGLGSGMTTNTLLSAPELERVDTIEIEPAMLEGARHFGRAAEKAFSDPRSQLQIEDAKTFFTSQQRKYDIIISEPPNPWVSGTAGLFSDEFYKVVKRSLNDDGVFCQWLHLYEINMDVIASVMKSISNNFPEYITYSSESDLIIVAAPSRKLDRLEENMLSSDPNIVGLRTVLDRISVKQPIDLKIRRFGGRKLLDPFFHSYNVPPHSDFYPVLEARAVRARFFKEEAVNFFGIRSAHLPLREILEKDSPELKEFDYTKNPGSYSLSEAQSSDQLYRYYLSKRNQKSKNLEINLIDQNLQMAVEQVQKIHSDCSAVTNIGAWLPYLHQVIVAMLPYQSRAEMLNIISDIRQSRCSGSLAPLTKTWIELYHAIVRRDLNQMSQLSHMILPDGPIPERGEFMFPLLVSMVADTARGDYQTARNTYNRYRSKEQLEMVYHVVYQLATSLALKQNQ